MVRRTQIRLPADTQRRETNYRPCLRIPVDLDQPDIMFDKRASDPMRIRGRGIVGINMRHTAGREIVQRITATFISGNLGEMHVAAQQEHAIRTRGINQVKQALSRPRKGAPLVHALLVGHDLGAGHDQPQLGRLFKLQFQPLPLGLAQQGRGPVIIGRVLADLLIALRASGERGSRRKSLLKKRVSSRIT